MRHVSETSKWCDKNVSLRLLFRNLFLLTGSLGSSCCFLVLSVTSISVYTWPLLTRSLSLSPPAPPPHSLLRLRHPGADARSFGFMIAQSECKTGSGPPSQTGSGFLERGAAVGFSDVFSFLFFALSFKSKVLSGCIIFGKRRNGGRSLRRSAEEQSK